MISKINLDKITFPKNPTTTWIIRTKNEEKWLGQVLESLFMQGRRDFEVIIVDSGSTDRTLEIVKLYPVRKIINISEKDFKYPYALNLGIKSAFGKYIGIISPHFLPTSRNWYADAFKNFSDPLVACVGGQYTSLPDGDYKEKLADIFYHIYRINQGDLFTGIQKDEYYKDLTNTNLLIRKDLWFEYNFDENLEESEDVDWFMEMRSGGFKTIFDPVFNDYHSYGGINKPIIQEQKDYILKKIIDINAYGTAFTVLGAVSYSSMEKIISDNIFKNILKYGILGQTGYYEYGQTFVSDYKKHPITPENWVINIRNRINTFVFFNIMGSSFNHDGKKIDVLGARIFHPKHQTNIEFLTNSRLSFETDTCSLEMHKKMIDTYWFKYQNHAQIVLTFEDF